MLFVSLTSNYFVVSIMTLSVASNALPSKLSGLASGLEMTVQNVEMTPKLLCSLCLIACAGVVFIPHLRISLIIAQHI